MAEPYVPTWGELALRIKRIHAKRPKQQDAHVFEWYKQRLLNAEQREYFRDLALRARNGQVGSGMKFR